MNKKSTTARHSENNVPEVPKMGEEFFANAIRVETPEQLWEVTGSTADEFCASSVHAQTKVSSVAQINRQEKDAEWVTFGGDPLTENIQNRELKTIVF